MDQKYIAKEARRVVEGGEADRQSQRPGDNRTPDRIIGQVKYADNEGEGEEKKSSTGSTRTSLDPAQGQRPTSKPKAEQSQMEGPAAYAPHEDEGERAFPDRQPAKKKTGEF